MEEHRGRLRRELVDGEQHAAVAHGRVLLLLEDRFLPLVREVQLRVVVELDGHLGLDVRSDLRLTHAHDVDDRQDPRVGRRRLLGQDVPDGGPVHLGVTRRAVVPRPVAARRSHTAQRDHEDEPRDPRSHRRRG